MLQIRPDQSLVSRLLTRYKKSIKWGVHFPQGTQTGMSIVYLKTTF